MTPSLGPDQVDQLLKSTEPGARIYLIGAGGCGMSGLGHLLLDLGFAVCGSDLVQNEEVRQLQSRGAEIHLGHDAAHLSDGLTVVVFTSAITSDHPELKAALTHGLPAVRRAVLLAALLHRQRAICVAGMHGKTTTAALLSFALRQLGAQASYAVGALVPQLTPHAHWARAESNLPVPWFVIEADESDGTLRTFRPQHAILLNIDAEHLDHFANLDSIGAEFREFAGQTSGHVIFCADDARLGNVLARNPHAISFGFHPLASYRVEMDEPVASSSEFKSTFQVWHKGTRLGAFGLRLLGQQNVSNAAAVIALLHELGFAPDHISGAIGEFRGAARRQQELYAAGGVRIFEDYGHHPTEIRATVRALRSLRPERLLVAFQPHRFTRTQHLWREFANCFGEVDRLWLADLYAASESAIPGITSDFLADAIRAQGQRVEGVLPVSGLSRAIRAVLRSGDLVLFLGAGDITRAAHELANDLQNSSVMTGPGGDAARPQMTRSTLKPEVIMNAELFSQLAARLAPEAVLRTDEPLAKRTTLRVGGKADLYVEPSSEEDLAEVLRFCSGNQLPFLVLGRGSNLLIRDGGMRGVVICLAHARFSQVQITDERLICGAGARLKAVAVEARRHGLSGLEFLEGIPGSVGGAMRMNAGAMGSWLFDVVETIRFMDHSGSVHERRAAEVNVEYRGCPLFKSHIALGAVLRGQTAPREAIQARMESFSRKRWESQPNQPSAGCIFKNPTTIPAGKLIDELGLKGTRVGGASISDVHANFIVNDGSATARDVLALIEVIKGRARSARGIELETEVEILGDE